MERISRREWTGMVNEGLRFYRHASGTVAVNALLGDAAKRLSVMKIASRFISIIFALAVLFAGAGRVMSASLTAAPPAAAPQMTAPQATPAAPVTPTQPGSGQ